MRIQFAVFLLSSVTGGSGRRSCLTRNVADQCTSEPRFRPPRQRAPGARCLIRSPSSSVRFDYSGTCGTAHEKPGGPNGAQRFARHVSLLTTTVCTHLSDQELWRAFAGCRANSSSSGLPNPTGGSSDDAASVVPWAPRVVALMSANGAREAVARPEEVDRRGSPVCFRPARDKRLGVTIPPPAPSPS